MIRATHRRGVLVVCFLVLVPCHAGACGCLDLSVADALTLSAAVFSGTADSIAQDGRWWFSVDRLYSGSVGAGSVQIENGDGTCGADFRVGVAHLIYGVADDTDELSTNLCMRTTSLRTGLSDVVELEQNLRDGRDYGLVGLVMSESLSLQDQALRASRSQQLSTALVDLVEDSTGEMRADRVLVHSLGLGTQTLVVQVFESTAPDMEPPSSTVIERLKDLHRMESGAVDSVIGSVHPGYVRVLLNDPLEPSDEQGNRIAGWFARDGTGVVGWDDFFLFADFFGLEATDPSFDPLYDLDDSGRVDFDDFFLFADDFGKEIVNVDLFRDH